MKPEISFVIPYYKKADTIKKCLKSLLNQSIKKKIEIIVVMDGPDPEGEKILKGFGNKIQIIKHGENRGGSAARNTGRSFARGKYISFWDADSIIEPGAAAVWLQVFGLNPEVDFVYAGYAFDEGEGAVPAQPFSPFLLKMTNYISGHFPIKLEKCPQWDESLKSLQDWDFWLTVVDNGCKGHYIRGYSFRTQAPDNDSVSGDSSRNWYERWSAVRLKHNIPLQKMCVSSLEQQELGLAMAKALDCDFMEMPSFKDFRHQEIIQIGFNPNRANQHAKVFAADTTVKRVLFWTPQDVRALLETPWMAVEGLVETVNAAVPTQFAVDQSCRRYLEKMGFQIKAIIPLPFYLTENDKAESLPETPKVLVDIDPSFTELFSSVQRACPDISMDMLTGAVEAKDYSVLLSFCQSESASASMRKMLITGRRVISNVKGLYCGYLSDKKGSEEFRRDLIKKIRKLVVATEPDVEASKYYLNECAPATFTKRYQEAAK